MSAASLLSLFHLACSASFSARSASIFCCSDRATAPTPLRRSGHHSAAARAVSSSCAALCICGCSESCALLCALLTLCFVRECLRAQVVAPLLVERLFEAMHVLVPIPLVASDQRSNLAHVVAHLLTERHHLLPALVTSHTDGDGEGRLQPPHHATARKWSSVIEWLCVWPYVLVGAVRRWTRCGGWPASATFRSEVFASPSECVEGGTRRGAAAPPPLRAAMTLRTRGRRKRRSHHIRRREAEGEERQRSGPCRWPGGTGETDARSHLQPLVEQVDVQLI